LKKNKAAGGDDIFTQKNLDTVQNYIRMQESYISKEIKTLKVKEFPSNHTWFNA